jgi:hypothetical protein
MRRSRLFIAAVSPLPALLLATLFAGCAILAPFNQYSFDETARLKVESLSLIRKAKQPYAVHAQKADSVMAGMNSAYRDALLRSKNLESLKQWEILLDPEQGSLAGTIRKWKWSGTLPADTIAAARKRIARNFDEISRLEGNKGK